MRAVPIALTLLVLPAPAAAQEMCAALNRVAAAALEEPAFASLGDRREEVVPGFNQGCRISHPQEGPTLVCSRGQFAPESLIAEALGRRVRDCLSAVPQPPARPFDRGLRYMTRDLVITVSSHCSERCHVGRSAMLKVRRRIASDGPQASDPR